MAILALHGGAGGDDGAVAPVDRSAPDQLAGLRCEGGDGAGACWM